MTSFWELLNVDAKNWKKKNIWVCLVGPWVSRKFWAAQPHSARFGGRKKTQSKMLQNNRCRLCKWCWDPNSQLQILGLWLFIVWTHTQLSLFSVQPCNTPFLGEKPRLPWRPQQATTGSNTAVMSVKRCCKAACKKSPQNLRAWKADWRAHLGQECIIVILFLL